MGVARDVDVQPVHELPAVVFAEHLQPARDVQEPGARRVRVGHDDMTLVDLLGQVLPGLGRRQVVFGRFHRVVADRRDPGVHPDPGRRIALVDELRIELVHAFGRIGLEHAFAFQEKQRGRRQSPDDIGLRVVLLRQELGGDDAGRVAHPFDLDVRVVLVEQLGIALEVLRLDRGIDGEFRLSRRRSRPQPGNAAGHYGDGRTRRPQNTLSSHLFAPLHLVMKSSYGRAAHPPRAGITIAKPITSGNGSYRIFDQASRAVCRRRPDVRLAAL